MAKGSSIPKSTGELWEEFGELKLRIALQELQEEELNRVAEKHQDNTEMLRWMADGMSDMERRISHGVQRMHARRALRRTLPNIGKIAACMLLVFYVGLSIAVAAVPSVRVEVLKFITSIDERYTSFGFESTGEYIDIPAEWEGYYFPAYIPEGYMLSESLQHEVEYVNNEGNVVCFTEMNSDTCGTIDTENAAVEFDLINGRSALIVEKGDWTTILWNIDNRSLMIHYSGEDAEAIEIAESVRMIRE